MRQVRLRTILIAIAALSWPLSWFTERRNEGRKPVWSLPEVCPETFVPPTHLRRPSIARNRPIGIDLPETPSPSRLASEPPKEAR